MMNVGDILSTVGEINLLLFEYPHGTEHPTVLMISPHMYNDILHGTQDNPHGTHDIPLRY